MSLINYAAPFSSSSSSSSNSNNNGKKRVPQLQQTFESIKQEDYKEPLSSLDTDIHDNKKKAEKINSIIEKMSNQNKVQADNDGAELSNFQKHIPKHPSVPEPNSFGNSPDFPKSTLNSTSKPMESVTVQESFMNPSSIHKQRGSSYSTSYTPTPYYKGMSTSQVPTNGPIAPMGISSSSQLMEKLNYMIHLLEEQQKEPTQNIMEEFVLYGLLGVFMIYLVDSFARAGKYIR
jgi:hypothetical protein